MDSGKSIADRPGTGRSWSTLMQTGTQFTERDRAGSDPQSVFYEFYEGGCLCDTGFEWGWDEEGYRG